MPRREARVETAERDQWIGHLCRYPELDDLDDAFDVDLDDAFDVDLDDRIDDNLDDQIDDNLDNGFDVNLDDSHHGGPDVGWVVGWAGCLWADQCRVLRDVRLTDRESR
jgi:hypothetical protein